MITRIFGVLLCVITLTGCVSDLVDMFPGPQPLPDESIAELIAQKSSFMVSTSTYPESVNARFNDQSILSIEAGDMSLIFLLPEADIRPRSEGVYFYSFSKESDGDFEVLRNLKFSEGGTLDTFYIEMYRTPVITNMNDIPDIAEEYLNESPVFIPINATHAELRFLPMTSNEYELELRVPLENYYGWQRYISPLINDNN